MSWEDTILLSPGSSFRSQRFALAFPLLFMIASLTRITNSLRGLGTRSNTLKTLT